MHKLPWPNMRKLADVMTGHLLTIAAMSGNIYSHWVTVITRSEIDDYHLLFVIDFAPWTQRYPKNFRKLGPGPVVCMYMGNVQITTSFN